MIPNIDATAIERRIAQAIARGEDAHLLTASLIFGVAADQVSSEQRRYAKQVNYVTLYSHAHPTELPK